MRVLSLVLCLALPTLVGAQEHDDAHEEEHDHAETTPDTAPIEVPEHRAIIQVEGLVCSFCAFGAEKAMADLEVLDRAQLNKGVHVDIDQHRMTLALVPGAVLPFYEIYTSIRAAGYEPSRIHFRVAGVIERGEDGLRIHDAKTGQRFALVGEAASALETGATVELQTYLDTTSEPKKKPEGPRQLVVTRRIDA